MDKVLDITPLEIRDYAKSYGWKLVKEALADGLFVLNHPEENGEQIVFPKSLDDSSFIDFAQTALQRLSRVHHVQLLHLINQIREVNDDVLSIRYFSESKNVNSISFEEALQAIQSTRQLLLASASTVVNPIRFHPRLNRLEPQELIKKARFRHTQEGSFVVNVSLPFELEQDPNPTLFGEDTLKPFSRKALEVANQSALDLLLAIEEDSFDELLIEGNGTEKSILSSNFCDAITELFDDERELPFELKLNWSRASILKLKPPNIVNSVKFPFSHRKKIESLKEFLKPSKNHNLSGKFYATVETLDGTLDDGNERSGQVVLSVLYENEILKTKANLGVAQYAKAVEAHKSGGSYLIINGAIERGKTVSIFNSVESVEKT